MSKKKNGKWTNFLAYLFLASVLSIIRNLPKKFAKRLCIKLGRMAYALDKKHRTLTISNLRMAFTEKSDTEITKLAIKVFENLGEALFDYTQIPMINENNFHDYIELEGTEYIDEAINKGKGVILITAHLCCWELLGWGGLKYGNYYVIAKDLHNRYVNTYVQELRREKGVEIIPARDSIKKIMEALRNKGIIVTMLDQYTHKAEAESVDFFGRKASTGYFPALMALKYEGISVIPMSLSRLEGGRYKITCQKPFEIIRSDDRKKDIYDNTQMFTKAIEDEIRKRPADWLWMHRRWRD